MQTFLLACYICLQLTNLPSLDQHTILKRDNSCDQCLTGIFDQSELYSHIGNQPKQTTGGLFASNPALKQALEERLMLELSRSALKPKVLPMPKEEPTQNTVLQDQVKKSQMMIDDSIKAGEIALKTIQEKVVQDIRRKTDEMTLQLQQQQTQMARELELQGARQREILMKEVEMMKQEMKAFNQQESKKKSEALEDFWKSYLEFVGSFLGEYKSILEGLTAQDLTKIMKEAKSILNGLTSKDYGGVMNEVFSFLSNPTSQEAKDIMKVYESFLKGSTSQDLKNMKKEPENMSEKTQKTEPKENITNRDVLSKNIRLMSGESLVSKNGRYKLTMRVFGADITDLHQSDRIVKTIGPQRITGFGPNYHLVMQSDGNLVIYTEIRNGHSVNPIWHTGTNSGDGSHFYLKLEDDGQLVMHNQLRGSKVWTSGKVESIQQNMHDL